MERSPISRPSCGVSNLALGVLFAIQLALNTQAMGAPLCHEIFRENSSSTTSLSLNLEKSFRSLIDKNILLTQNADFLPEEGHGGTCMSTTATNSILTLAEAIKPGSISSRNPRWDLFAKSRQTLARNLLLDFLRTLKTRYNKDVITGAEDKEIASIFQEIYERHIGKLPLPLHFRPIDAKTLQSIKVGGNSILHGAITHPKMKGQYHAVIIHEIKPTPTNLRKGRDGELTFVISDPHNPNKLQDIHVFADGSRLISEEGYLFATGMVINLGSVPKVKEWTARHILDVLNGEESRHANITLTDGTVLQEVKVLQPFSETDNHVDIAQRFYLLGKVTMAEIADIQWL